jgi:carboxymethylenebutenolidase
MMNVETRWVTCPNGDVEVSALLARPAGSGSHPGLVVVPENIGLTDARQEETAEMASHGLAVLAISPYSRIGGSPPAGPFKDDDERRRANFLAMPDEQIVGDILAAAAWLSSQPFVAGGVGALGFCSGGSQAFVTASTHPGIFECLVSIYGNIVLPAELTPDWKPVSRLPLVRSLSCPFQGHFGSDDFVVPPADVDALEDEFRAQGIEAEIYRYAGAGHVFAGRAHPNYNREAAELMWPRVYNFLSSHLAVPQSA